MRALIFLLFTTFLLAAGPPRIVVARDGSGDYTTVQAAVDAAGPSGTVIRIRPGTYEEKLTIAKPGIQLRGLGTGPGQVVLTFHLNATSAGGTFKSASTTVTGDDFYAENLTFQNSYVRPPDRDQGTQAVALRVTGDRAVFRRVRFLGHQDTLYATTLGCMGQPGETCRPARQYFEECYIEGDIDFIFGDSQAYFENCEIHALRRDPVYLTAQSKSRPDLKSGYVFHRCRLTAEPGARVYLGRPWRKYSTVVYLDTEMCPEIDPAGWREWAQGGQLALSTAYYAEYNSRGPGARPQDRDPDSLQLTGAEAAQFDLRRFLAGDDNWNPRRLR